jgi:hypothetical protein
MSTSIRNTYPTGLQSGHRRAKRQKLNQTAKQQYLKISMPIICDIPVLYAKKVPSRCEGEKL